MLKQGVLDPQGKANGHADHVLLGDTDIEVAVRKKLGERLKHRESKIGIDEPHRRIALCDVKQGANEGISHVDVSISAIA